MLGYRTLQDFHKFHKIYFILFGQMFLSFLNYRQKEKEFFFFFFSIARGGCYRTDTLLNKKSLMTNAPVINDSVTFIIIYLYILFIYIYYLLIVINNDAYYSSYCIILNVKYYLPALGFYKSQLRFSAL